MNWGTQAYMNSCFLSLSLCVCVWECVSVRDIYIYIQVQGKYNSYQTQYITPVAYTTPPHVSHRLLHRPVGPRSTLGSAQAPTTSHFPANMAQWWLQLQPTKGSPYLTVWCQPPVADQTSALPFYILSTCIHMYQTLSANASFCISLISTCITLQEIMQFMWYIWLAMMAWSHHLTQTQAALPTQHLQF
jgi:hypothetical protein